MNTFLPYKSLIKSAECLDYRRLGKQRCETWQIYLALTKKNYGWKNHPAVKMWKGYEKALLEYGLEICNEWVFNRNFKDTMRDRFINELIKLGGLVNQKPYNYCSDYILVLKRKDYPKWLGNKKFHAAMRSNLLRKDYKYYKQFKWKERRNLPYYWPV